MLGGAPAPLHEEPEHEVALLSAVEGGGDDAVAALGQQQALAHLAEVDERVGAVDLTGGGGGERLLLDLQA